MIKGYIFKIVIKSGQGPDFSLNGSISNNSDSMSFIDRLISTVFSWFLSADFLNSRFIYLFSKKHLKSRGQILLEQDLLVQSYHWYLSAEMIELFSILPGDRRNSNNSFIISFTTFWIYFSRVLHLSFHWR